VLWSRNTQLHYPFQNTALDYSGNARHGTVNGSGVYATKPNGGRCLYFDGTGDYVATPSFGLSGTVVVFACWVSWNKYASANQFLLSGGIVGATTDHFRCYRTTNADHLRWGYANGTTTAVAGSNNFFAGLDGIWTHVIIVCNYAVGDSVQFYRNGAWINSTATTGVPMFPSSTNSKEIGDQGGVNFIVNGYLANVQLWTLPTMPATAQMLANANRMMLGMNPIW